MNMMQIDRSMWACGHNPEGNSLDYGGRKCCLGFYGYYLGAEPGSLEGHGLPSDCRPACKWDPALWYEHGIYTSPHPLSSGDPTLDNWEYILAFMNDTSDIDNETRESWIAAGFKILFNIDVEFVGKYEQ